MGRHAARARRRLSLAAIACLLAGCGGSAPPPPASLQLTIKGATDQNRSTDGAASPVAVRLFLLKASGRFSAADAYALMDRAASTLGEDVAGTEALLLRPGETRAFTLSPPPGVKYLGSTVLFREIDRARWRDLAPVAAQGSTELTLTLSGTQAYLAPP